MSTAPGHLNWPFAAAWAASTLIGWLLAIWLINAGDAISYYLLAGMFAQIVTVGLRCRLITARLPTRVSGIEPPTSTNWMAMAAAGDHELTWVLCWISQLHVLGIALLGPGLVPALGLGLAFVVSEILLLRFAPPEWRELLPQWWPEKLSPTRENRPLESAFDSPEVENDSEFDVEDDESEFESEKISATFHGLSDEGLPYLQGWQRYEMIAGQKSISLTIAFSPPFLSPPECELDHEGDEEIKLEIEHITPAGARVNLKRRNASSVTDGKMLWHCSSQMTDKKIG